MTDLNRHNPLPSGHKGQKQPTASELAAWRDERAEEDEIYVRDGYVVSDEEGERREKEVAELPREEARKEQAEKAKAETLRKLKKSMGDLRRLPRASREQIEA